MERIIYNYRFVVPAYTTATVYIPTANEKGVVESGKRAIKSTGIKFLEVRNGKIIYELEPGEFKFKSKILLN